MSSIAPKARGCRVPTGPRATKAGSKVRTPSHSPVRHVGPDPVPPPVPTEPDPTAKLDAVFLAFLRSEVGEFKAPLHLVVKSLKRDAPAVLSALTFPSWADVVHASIDRAVRRYKADRRLKPTV